MHARGSTLGTRSETSFLIRASSSDPTCGTNLSPTPTCCVCPVRPERRDPKGKSRSRPHPGHTRDDLWHRHFCLPDQLQGTMP